MSRSRRHSPVCGLTTARTDRQFKQMWHRGLRSANRQRIRMGREPLHVREYVMANLYRSQKDGKQTWWVERAAPWGYDPEAYRAIFLKLMRK